MMHQEVFDNLRLPVPAKLVPFQDYSAATMYVDWNIANTIYYKVKDWRFPMSPSEHDRFCVQFVSRVHACTSTATGFCQKPYQDQK